MRVWELVEKKRQKVKIRVPAHLRDALGATAEGTVVGISPGGSVTMVRVKVVGSGEFHFRPQDVRLASAPAPKPVKRKAAKKAPKKAAKKAKAPKKAAKKAKAPKKAAKKAKAPKKAAKKVRKAKRARP